MNSARTIVSFLQEFRIALLYFLLLLVKKAAPLERPVGCKGDGRYITHTLPAYLLGLGELTNSLGRRGVSGRGGRGGGLGGRRLAALGADDGRLLGGLFRGRLFERRRDGRARHLASLLHRGRGSGR